jgi:hypothetical protein
MIGPPTTRAAARPLSIAVIKAHNATNAFREPRRSRRTWDVRPPSRFPQIAPQPECQKRTEPMTYLGETDALVA